MHNFEIVGLGKTVNTGRWASEDEQVERKLREAFAGVQGAGPLAGVARGQRPLA